MRGWKPGLKKVALTRVLREGGLGLAEAIEATGRVLDDEEVTVHLAQFDRPEPAVAVLHRLGIVEVRAVGQATATAAV